MANENSQPDRMWDEYDWERFFQAQDKKTERYLDLLDKYADHPDRDALIAQEMGWPEAWCEEGVEEGPEDETSGYTEDGTQESERGGRSEESPEQHPLYQQMESLTLWLEHAWSARGALFDGEPVFDELTEQMSILSANIVASLSGQEDGELGMTIAFLKRSLRAANLALNAGDRVFRMGIFGRVRHKHLRGGLFAIRNEVVRMIGEQRMRWRRLQEDSR
jgi:hypothetical protein